MATGKGSKKPINSKTVKKIGKDQPTSKDNQGVKPASGKVTGTGPYKGGGTC